MQKSTSRWLLVGGAAVGLALLLALAVMLVRVSQKDPEPASPPATGVAPSTPSPSVGWVTAHPGTAPQEWPEPPAISDPPTQIELGHAEYWTSCMVCHGDRGQGLTEEWRSVLNPADTDCWQSRCHAANHPPETFPIPPTLPELMGPDALTGFETAADLFAYISEAMPWHAPGLVQEEQVWQLTAFLLDANQVDLGKPLHDPDKAETCTCEGACECQRPKEPLGPDNAAQFLIIPQLVQTHKTAIETEQVVAGVVVGLFLAAAVGYWLLRAL